MAQRSIRERHASSARTVILVASVLVLTFIQAVAVPVTIDSPEDAAFLLSQPDDLFQAWIDASNQCPGSGSSFVTDIDRQAVKKVYTDYPDEQAVPKDKVQKKQYKNLAPALQLSSVRQFCTDSASLELQRQMMALQRQARFLLATGTAATLAVFRISAQNTMAKLLTYLRDPDTPQNSLAALSASKIREGLEEMIVRAGDRFLTLDQKIAAVRALIREWGLEG